MFRLRIQDRILLLVLGVIVPFAITTFFVVERRITREAHEKLADELGAALTTFNEVRRQREEDLVRTSRLIAELPYFKAAVAVYDRHARPDERTEQINTIEPVSRDIMRSVGLDYLAVLSDSGRALLSLRGGLVEREIFLDAPTRALEHSLLTQGAGVGSLVAADELYQVVMAPMVVDGNVFGVLLLGRRLDKEMASRLREMTHTDILIAGRGGLTAIAAMDSSATRSAAAWEWLHAEGAAGTPGQAPSLVKLGGTRYLSRTEPILNPIGEQIGAFVLQRSLDEALVYAAAIRHLMILIWAGALAAALLLSSILASQMSRPIQRLVELTGRISGGDFSREVPVKGADELAGLAGAFNRMTRGLRLTLDELAASNKRLAERGHELEEKNRELREAQAQLIQASKLAAIGELGAGLAHELNQPLTSVKGFAQLLAHRLGMESPHRKTLGHIEQAADHMGRIVRNLRDFSRESKGERLNVDLNQVVEASLILVETQFRQRQIHLELDLQHDLPAVHGDPNQIQQVLTNLLTNARDALEGRGPGRVRLVTRSRRGFVLVRVEDCGPGISADVRANMFRAFYTTKDVGKGTGLGLSISRGIADTHHGRLGVHSRPGIGATFWLILPESTDQAQLLEKAA